jgi:hypothetical protein
MHASGYDESLKCYQRTWRWAALVPSSAVLLFWTYLAFTCVRRESPEGSALQMLRDAHIDVPLGPWTDYTFRLAVGLLHCLSVLSPMLAWDRVRGAMRRTPSPSEPPQGGYRDRPEQPATRSWHVSGPFPWWAALMFFVAVLIHFSWLTLQFYVPYSIGILLGPWSESWNTPAWFDKPLEQFVSGGFAYTCFFYVWWKLCRRDASRVGVIEEATSPDGSRALVLHTPREVRLVTIAECDRPARRLLLFGSPESWHVVEPIDDLVRVDPTHMRHDGRGE